MLSRSFLPPIEEYSVAADFLAHAADALLDTDIEICKALLKEADL